MPTKTKPKKTTPAKPAAAPEPPATIAPPALDENEELLSKHIRCTDTGIIVEGDLPLEKWAKGFEFFQKIGSKTQWWRGDMLLYGERKYGESYAQAVDIHGKSESRLQTYVYVCSKFPMERRRPELSFDHHAEAASLEAREADALLLRAIRERWTKMDVREEVAKINERNGVPKRGRKPGSTAAKIAASGNSPTLALPDADKTPPALIWNGHPLAVCLTTRRIFQGPEPLPQDEAYRAAHHFQHAHGPALATWLDQHGFTRKEGDAECQTSHAASSATATTKLVNVHGNTSNGASVVPSDAAPNMQDLVNIAFAPAPAPSAPPAATSESAGLPTPPETSAPCVICNSPITPYDSYGVGAGIGHRYHWECVKREAALVSSPQPTDEEWKRLTAERDDAREQLKRFEVHVDMEKMDTAPTNTIGRLTVAAPGSIEPFLEATPLERAEAAILAFNEASREVDWSKIGPLATKKWLSNLLRRADEVIDELQKQPPTPRK